MQTKYLLTGLLFINVLYSCKKNDTSTTVADNRNISDIIMNYQAFSNKNVSGQFFIQSLTFNDQSGLNKMSTEIGGGFFDKNGNAEIGGTLSIGSHELSAQNGSYSLDKLSRDEFYGKKVNFRLIAPHHGPVMNGITSGSTQFDTILTSLYVPTDIYVNTTNFNPDPSNAITWNADPNNTNGVVIVAEYNPKLTLNDGIAATYPVPIRNSINVADNGSTILPASFYASFPKGSSIVLYVGRGNYTIATANSYDYKIGAYTANAVFVITVPAPPSTGGGGAGPIKPAIPK